MSGMLRDGDIGIIKNTGCIGGKFEEQRPICLVLALQFTAWPWGNWLIQVSVFPYVNSSVQNITGLL